VLAATIAADLDAWTRLLLLRDEPELAAAEPETIRMKLYHLPACTTAHARRRILHLGGGHEPRSAPITICGWSCRQVPSSQDGSAPCLLKILKTLRTGSSV
jgi:hypothetical protein